MRIGQQRSLDACKTTWGHTSDAYAVLEALPCVSIDKLKGIRGQTPVMNPTCFQAIHYHTHTYIHTYIRIHLYIHTYIHTHIYIYLCIYLSIYIYIYCTCISRRMGVHLYVYIYICMYVCMHAMYVCIMYRCTCMCVYMYVCMYVCMYVNCAHVCKMTTRLVYVVHENQTIQRVVEANQSQLLNTRQHQRDCINRSPR